MSLQRGKERGRQVSEGRWLEPRAYHVRAQGHLWSPGPSTPGGQASSCLSLPRDPGSPHCCHKAVSARSKAFHPSWGCRVSPHGSTERPREPRARPHSGDHIGAPLSWQWALGPWMLLRALGYQHLGASPPGAHPPLTSAHAHPGPGQLESICPATPGCLETRAGDRQELSCPAVRYVCSAGSAPPSRRLHTVP